MKHYFPTQQIANKFNKLSENQKWKVLQLAQLDAESNRSQLDYKPNMYAVLSKHIKESQKHL